MRIKNDLLPQQSRNTTHKQSRAVVAACEKQLADFEATVLMLKEKYMSQEKKSYRSVPDDCPTC